MLCSWLSHTQAISRILCDRWQTDFHISGYRVVLAVLSDFLLPLSNLSTFVFSLYFDPILDVLKASLFVWSTPEGVECGKGKETALRITGK